ncbi:hypothetical protein BYT27DRAFT_7115052 [Phlegmacium glaucopus]|nr:hypothetical protein BYT27DRAFT_7115052 [Phlegmacium glaucopus]
MEIDESDETPTSLTLPAYRNRALTSRQERKLVAFLDDLFLQLTRNYKKRSDISSTLRTLPAYLEAARHLLLLVIQIPPIDPSTGLRIAYLLRLTGDVLSAIPGYQLETPNTTSFQEALRDLLEFLGDLDQAWLAVLQSQVWDPSTAQAVDLVIAVDDDASPDSPSTLNIRSTPPNQTEVTRLRSLLFTGESALEEWLTNEKTRVDDADNDVSGMLERMGLLEEFDSLFVRTLDFLGGFTGTVAEQGEELVME